MINILLGPPGAGKSYEAVVYHILPALGRGRKVITNLPLNLEALGAIDASYPGLVEIREKTLAKAPAPIDRDKLAASTADERQKVARWKDRAFANVEDYASDWRHEDGGGPLYVVDECHFCLPVGLTQIGVEEWFSMHRHHNADVLLISQSSGKISRSIRDLVQVCYKVRKAVGLGKPDGYIRRVFDGVGGGEMSESVRAYKPQMFGLWKSHTQGVAMAEAKADDVAPFLVKFNRFKWAWLGVSVIVCVWAFWPKAKKPAEPPWVAKAVAEAKAHGPVVNPPDPPPEGAPVQKNRATAPPVAPQDPNDVPEPYADKGLHLTGVMSMGAKTIYYFAISQGGQRITDTRSVDLVQAGYRWEPLTECAGTLRWKGKSRPITCDAPRVAAGTNDKPVVVGIPPSGNSTVTPSSLGKGA